MKATLGWLSLFIRRNLMASNIPVNHHYVPQFLLRNFAADQEMIYMYRLKEQRIVKRNIKYNYNKDNLYKDVSEDDVMLVERLFSELEGKVAAIINRILDSRNQIVLDRLEVEMIKRFLYLMEFRSKRRKSQYENKNFTPLTEMILDMKIEGKEYVQLWLNELKILLQHTKYDMDYNNLSLAIHWDFEYYMDQTFIVIWDACQDERFLITDNFGTFELSRENPPLKLFLLFPISPRRMIVLANKLYEFPNSWKELDSEFSNDIVEFPKNERVSRYEINMEDKYTYQIKRVRNKDVIHANELLINETYEYFTFNDPDSIRRSVEKYMSRPEGYTKNKITLFELNEE
jgi:hypothetical protein